MLHAPEVIATDTLHAAVIHLKVPCEEMQQVFGPAIDEIVATLQAQGLEPVGPAFAHHFSVPTTHFDFEVGLPVARPVSPTGRVKAGELPACPRVAHATHVGPYDGLSASWAAFESWISDQALSTAQTFWESYTVGPHNEPSPAKWRTDLYRPLDA